MDSLRHWPRTSRSSLTRVTASAVGARTATLQTATLQTATLKRVALSLALFASACRGSENSGRAAPADLKAQAPSSSVSSAAPSAKPLASVQVAAVAPTLLLSLPKSAYHVSLHLDGDTTYLLTEDALFRMRPGREPEGTKIELGEGPIATHSAFIFWSKGSVFSVPKEGGKPQKLSAWERKPQYFVTSGDNFAWIDRTDGGRYSVVTLRDSKPVVIHRPEGNVDAATMVGDWVFFVERIDDKPGSTAFRFVGVPLHGKSPSFTPYQSGRSPATLVADSRIYYYDVNTNEMHALSPDFQENRILGKNVICSPFAVTDNIYCGHVEGLHELSLKDQQMRRVDANERTSITALAASRDRVVWVSDAGRDSLSVKMLPRTQ